MSSQSLHFLFHLCPFASAPASARLWYVGMLGVLGLAWGLVSACSSA